MAEQAQPAGPPHPVGPGGAGLFSNVRGDIMAAIAVATISVPSAIGVGLIAFSPLGPDYAALGALGGLYGMIFLTLVPALTGSSAFQFNGPGPVEAGILAGLLAGIVGGTGAAAGLGLDATDVIPVAITCIFLSGLLTGAFEVLVGQARLGTIVKLIPYPVVAGVLNGVAVLIFSSQIPKFLGMPARTGWRDLLMGSAGVTPTDIAVGCATLLAIYLARRFKSRLPDLLAGLIGGTLTYHALRFVLGAGPMGKTMGAAPTTLPKPTQLQPMLAFVVSPAFLELLPLIVGTAVTIAMISSISCLLAATTADIVSNRRHSSVRELTGLGVANIVCAVFAGLPGGGTPARVLTNYRAGGRTRLSHVVCALILLAFVSGLGPLIGTIPVSAVAGTLFALALMLVDGWTRLMAQRLLVTRDREARVNIALNLGVVALVTLLVVFWDLILAIAVGMLGQLLIFLFLAGRTFIRRTYTGDVVHSRTVRRLEAANVLSEEGDTIQVIELQANLFFGTADELTKLVDSIPARTRFVILDFKRVTEVDSTGVLILKRMDSRLKSERRQLLLSYLPASSERRRSLRHMGLTEPESEGRLFDDTNAALAFAEAQILSARDASLVRDDEIPLRKAGPVANLSEQQFAKLEARLEHRSYAAGDYLMRAGEDAAGMFILTQGRVDVLRPAGDGARAEICLVSFGPGTTVGEMALMSRDRRSADVRAAVDSACYFLSIQAFEGLRHEDPELALAIVFSLAASLSRRLAANTNTIVQLED